jgi:membrane protease YdiL (CAAX protease family)
VSFFEFKAVTVEAALWSVIVVPIVEEIVFRGVIQKELTQKIEPKEYSSTIANFVTSVLFLLLHVYYSGLLAAAVFVPSLILGYIFSVTGKLRWSILVHAWFNLSWVVVVNFS